MLSQISAPTSPVYNSNSTGVRSTPTLCSPASCQPSRQKEDISESCLGRMPKESYEGIKAAASQDIPISSLRVAAPRRGRRRQHVAAVALSAADTRRRMGAGLLRHRSGTVRVPVRPQRQPVRDGSRQDATRDVRVGALAAGNKVSGAERGRCLRPEPDGEVPQCPVG